MSVETFWIETDNGDWRGKTVARLDIEVIEGDDDILRSEIRLVGVAGDKDVIAGLIRLIKVCDVKGDL